jgi:DNA (cytosine-5)-methyltransferase 1
MVSNSFGDRIMRGIQGNIASLFCGAGGLDLGFIQAGFKISYAVDSDWFACVTYAVNHGLRPEWRDISYAYRRPGRLEYDVVIGGPPCQGVSNYRGRSRRDPSAMSGFAHFFKFVRKTRPLCFVMENVRGLATMYGGRYLSFCLDQALASGYNAVYFTLNAACFGVAQSRTRIFIVGFRHDVDARFAIPSPTHGARASRPYRTIRDALRRVDEPETNDTCKEGFGPVYLSRNRRRGWGELSWVIPACCKDVPLHPDSPPLIKVGTYRWALSAPASKYRRFSWQECAALQGFPRRYVFVGSLRSRYRLVGNAVPPPLAEAVARSLRDAKVTELRQPYGLLEVEAGARPWRVGGVGAVEFNYRQC